MNESMVTRKEITSTTLFCGNACLESLAIFNKENKSYWSSEMEEMIQEAGYTTTKVVDSLNKQSMSSFLSNNRGTFLMEVRNDSTSNHFILSQCNYITDTQDRGLRTQVCEAWRIA